MALPPFLKYNVREILALTYYFISAFSDRHVDALSGFDIARSYIDFN